MTINKGWRPWIAFNDQSESYVHGFEAGMIYQQMLNGDEISQMIHEENQGQIEAIANKLGYKYIVSLLQDGWCQFEAYKGIRRIK